MGYLADLETARDNAAATLASITANPKPSYSVRGQTIQWSAYHNMLTESIRRINDLIQAGEVDSEPFELHSQGLI